MSDVLSLASVPVANVLASIPLGSIPSPSVSYLQLGPFRVHFYALCILAGMAVCLWLGSRRWKAAGGTPERVFDVAMWAIPAGIIGARAYHVLITDPGSYFGPNVADPWAFLKIWEGGIGIMGAVSVGALGAWYGCRRYGMNFPAFADAVAPGILLAQAFGRWGNWFNQELFGKPTTLPWGLQIDAAHMPAGYPAGTLFHPTFLYECLWNLAAAALIVWLDRRHRFAGGQVFGLYLMAYTAGRCWIEMLRIDDAHRVLGLRLNVWTSLLVFALGLLVFVVAGRLGRSTRVVPDDSNDEAEASSDEEDTQASADKADTDTSSIEVAEGSSDDSEPDRS